MRSGNEREENPLYQHTGINLNVKLLLNRTIYMNQMIQSSLIHSLYTTIYILNGQQNVLIQKTVIYI